MAELDGTPFVFDDIIDTAPGVKMAGRWSGKWENGRRVIYHWEESPVIPNGIYMDYNPFVKPKLPADKQSWCEKFEKNKIRKDKSD